jgi:hypothetical protein
MSEGLEPRLLLSGNPTVYTVNLTSDTGAGSGSSGDLLYCITQANNQGEPGFAPANSAGSEIEFAPAVFGTTITLSSRLLLSESDGPEVIDGPSAGVTISGDNAVEVFQVDSGTTASLSELTISGGATAVNGAGIENTGTLSVMECTIANNIDMADDDGGGIYNSGVLTVTDSTIADNVAGNNGGGIDNSGALTVTDSTIADNQAGGVSGSFVTTTDYIAGESGGGLYDEGGGTATLNNTIVALNVNNGALNNLQACDDIAGGPVSSASAYNLIGIGGSGGLTNGINSNLVDVFNPGLAPVLAGNGGPTQTIALLPNSPAIDGGGTSVIPSGVTTDQRAAGFPRTVNGTVDIGAIEGSTSSDLPTVYTVINTSASASDTGSLPWAINQANNLATNLAGSKITFDVPTSDPGYDATTGSWTITLSSTLELSEAIGPEVIQGPGPNSLTISGNNAVRDFQVDDVMASMSGLTISGSNFNGITNGGTLRVDDCIITNSLGGGIAGLGQELTVDDCIITNNSNSGAAGGAVLSEGMTTIINSTIADNRAGVGGGINNLGYLRVIGSTIDNNVDTNDGTRGGGGVYMTSGSMRFANCTIANNSAMNAGGGIFVYCGALTITDSTIVGNRTANPNSAPTRGNPGSGGGLYEDLGLVASQVGHTPTPATLQNTIVALNTDPNGPDDIDSFGVPGTFGLSSASAFNLVGSDLTGSLTNGVRGNIVGSNPLLGALANNGGPTQTIALLPGSPALDTGSNAMAVDIDRNPLTTDQRGEPRIVNGTIDIGAFEAQQEATTTTVSASPATSVFGQSMTFIATVAPQAGNAIPAGSIEFEIDGADVGNPVVLNASGTATLNLDTLGLPAEQHTISAVYTSDSTADFGDSTGTASIAVQTASSSATLSNIETAISDAPSTPGSSITIQVTSSTVSTALQAVNATSPTSPVAVTLDLGGASISPQSTAFEAPSNVQVDVISSTASGTVSNAAIASGTVVVAASVAPVNWTVNGGNVTVEGSASAGDFTVNGGTVTLADGTVITGNSPAITVNAGTVILQGVTAQTATNSPTIIVNGGSLLVRDSTIEGSTGYAEPAILINGGSVNLGTTASPGGNVISANDGGQLIENTTSSSVPDVGDTLEVNGTPLSETYLSFTALASSASSSVSGQSVTFTATVRGANPSDGTPTGTVDFVDTTTGVNLGTAAVTSGVASLTTSALPVGSNTIAADYEGDNNFAFSASTLAQTVNKASTSTAVGSSPNPSVSGQAVTLTATVSVTSPGTTAVAYPTGTVTFYANGTSIGTGTLGVVGGQDRASLSTSALASGSDSITAAYNSGDGNFNASPTSAAITQTVNKDGTTTSVSASPMFASVGQTVSFTATVTANAPGSGTPTGTVDFYDTTTSTDLTPGGVALSSGTAAFSTTSLAAGSHTIKATYSGDTNFLTSNASTGSITIGQSIIVLDPSAGGALSLSGNASIHIAGDVYVDSSSSSALSASGNAQTRASVIDVHGGVLKSGNASFSPTPVTGAATLPDPLASLPEPSPCGMTNNGSKIRSGNSSATINPGIYSQITVSGNGTLTLNSGTYIIEGGGFSISGNASVTGSGVMIVNAGSTYPTTGGTYGSITLSGTGSYNLTPPTSGTYAGIVIFQTRDNSKALTISGNASGMTGTVYAPATQLAASGNATLNAAVIVDTLTISGNGVANILSLSAPTGTVAYTPNQIRDAYGINSLSLDGTGQTIAIVDAYDNPSIFQALDVFDSQFTLTDSGPTLYSQYGPASSFLTVLNQYGQTTSLPSTDPNGPGTDNWEVEEALDVEWTHAIAPGAQIILVEANSQSLSDLMASVATAASQPGVSVVSMSWGFAEGQAVFASDEATYDNIFNVPGVTFVASTGDYGAADPEYPAFSPNVVAVGGTSLTLKGDNSYNSETGWGYQSDSVGAFIGSGGGISLYEPEPAYQQGVQSTGSRTSPDVSLVADPATGAWIADSYNLDPSNPFEIVGGTSLSAPDWACLLALVNQGRATAGESTLNSTSPTDTQQALYMLPQSDYNAIASGTNGYTAGDGYNLVTGLGSPVANLLVPDLIAYQGPATTYSGPTVGPLQNATLTNTGTSSSSPLDVFSVFDSLTVPRSGFGHAQDVVVRGGPSSPSSVTPPAIKPVAAGSAVEMMVLDTNMTAPDHTLTNGSTSRAALAPTKNSSRGSDAGPDAIGSRSPVLQAALVDAVLEEFGSLPSLLSRDGTNTPSHKPKQRE